MSFNEKVYAFLKQIPKGRVVSYGQVAVGVGYPYSARAVGYALHRNPNPIEIPCHRVVFKNGCLASGFAFGGEKEQARLLKAEGVEVSLDFKVDMERYQWKEDKC